MNIPWLVIKKIPVSNLTFLHVLIKYDECYYYFKTKWDKFEDPVTLVFNCVITNDRYITDFQQRISSITI